MTEQLITFETAKIAKEKGFIHFKAPLPSMIFDKEYLPSQSLLQKWIREVHKIHIVIIPSICSYTFKIIDVQCDPQNHIERPPYKDVSPNDWNKYEDTLEVGLIDALKLISIAIP